MSEESNRTEIKKLAHDLRNGLSSIYSYSQLLEISLTSPENVEEQKLAQSIHMVAKNMNDLITATLDAWKAE